MKHLIKVACAIIEHEQKVLVAQRAEGMDHPLEWEFPGGKILAGEVPGVCIVREVKEEINILIMPIIPLSPVTYDYGDKLVKLFPYICKFVQGDIDLLEHNQVQWLSIDTLPNIPLCAADISILQEYLHFKKKPVF
jgi:8-oxo-dGTP diphosphatase